MKFKLFLFSFFFFNILTAFATENEDKSTIDTLNIVPADTINLKDSIITAPADITNVQVPPETASSEFLERKGFHVLWVIIAFLLLLVFLGYSYKHKDH